MTSIEEHKRKIKEHLEEIDDAIEEGIEKKPITIGFHCSACALELLEIYLHIKNKLSPEKIIKHDWFKRPKEGQIKEALINRHFQVEFEKKDKIYNLIYDLEEKRNSLIYGKPEEEQIKDMLKKFKELKKEIMELLENEKFEL